MRKVKELYLTGENVTGAEAADIGMINYAWPEAELTEFAYDFNERLSEDALKAAVDWRDQPYDQKKY